MICKLCLDTVVKKGELEIAQLCLQMVSGRAEYGDDKDALDLRKE